jgi:hypothetical protein
MHVQLDKVQRRFCWAIGVPWNQATRVEARDFSRWIRLSEKVPLSEGREVVPARASARWPGAVNPVTGKASPGKKYAPTTIGHSETVMWNLRSRQAAPDIASDCSVPLCSCSQELDLALNFAKASAL